MDGKEVSQLVRVWGAAISSALYSYAIASKTEAGLGRAVLVAPVLVLFTALPFTLKTVSFGGLSFFYLTWLGNFKLILFALGLGPLVSQPNGKPLSLSHFTAVALLPIKIKAESESESPHRRRPPSIMRKIAKFLTFVLAIILLVHKHLFHEAFLQVVYFMAVGLGIEILLAVTTVPFAALLGIPMDDQFRDPQLATSLQDFWGSRWNLMTSNILRLTIYRPLREATSPTLGRLGGIVVGIIVSFIVSGLMHELIYYQYTRVNPTWEVTWFFVLHGVCNATEVVLKAKFYHKWQPPELVSMHLVSFFNAATIPWLFMPQILRNKVDEGFLDECFVVYDVLRSIVPGM